MDPAVAVIVVRGVITFVMVLGGILAIFFGFRLYLNGVGLEEDGTEITDKNSGISVKLRRVGTVLMATSVLWIAAAAYSLPKYSKERLTRPSSNQSTAERGSLERESASLNAPKVGPTEGEARTRESEEPDTSRAGTKTSANEVEPQVVEYEYEQAEQVEEEEEE